MLCHFKIINDSCMYSKQYIFSFICLSNHYTKNVLPSSVQVTRHYSYQRLCTFMHPCLPINVCNNTIARVPRIIRTRESDRSVAYTPSYVLSTINDKSDLGFSTRLKTSKIVRTRMCARVASNTMLSDRYCLSILRRKSNRKDN